MAGIKVLANTLLRLHYCYAHLQCARRITLNLQTLSNSHFVVWFKDCLVDLYNKKHWALCLDNGIHFPPRQAHSV